MSATMSTGRSDIHAPSNFDPADYRVIDYLDNQRPAPPDPRSGAYGNPEFMRRYVAAVAAWQARIFEHFPDWRTGGDDHQSISQCNHCGHPGIRWVAVVEHVPTGARLAFGEQCAERVELSGRDAFRARFIKTRAQREAAALAKAQAAAEFAAANPGLHEFLAAHEDDEFLGSLYEQLQRKGELSERQVEAARRSETRMAEWAARREADLAAITEPLREGRREIEGEIASVKEQHGNYGTTMKMLVREDDGNKVWGTIPEAVWEMRNTRDKDGYITEQRQLKGLRIRFTAAVERSRDDEHFGFFKRPTGAELVS